VEAESVLLDFHRLHDARLRLALQGRCCFPRCPYLAPKPGEIGLGLAGAVEPELDDDVVWIVGGPKRPSEKGVLGSDSLL
jgi:hypothetical protein